MERPALLIIDMQNDFVREGALLRVAQAESVIPKIREVLSAFRARNLPVFHVLRVHRSDGSDVEITRKEIFSRHPFAVSGSEGAREITELAPRPDEYTIEKVRMSAFIGTELDFMLRTLGVTELVVTGVQTPNCIRTTVFDAIAYNYPVTLVDDATGAQSGEIHRANILDMKNIGVRIMDTRTLVGTLG
ncbi:isochorismatase family cysteine hydrolase [Methanoregula sp.]|uniref:cysteine hydrolase family protein n=1 Tax=Methanoregula sp. TaxID=2052170 RepID=UPI002C8FD48B|nr:isochorismatase family cysteine hydrolase [Methanoregula sp.]HVP96648.1 isochorismatase family cysteine hydrolase [Methanoregula sp.]